MRMMQSRDGVFLERRGFYHALVRALGRDTYEMRFAGAGLHKREI